MKKENKVHQERTLEEKNNEQENKKGNINLKNIEKSTNKKRSLFILIVFLVIAIIALVNIIVPDKKRNIALEIAKKIDQRLKFQQIKISELDKKNDPEKLLGEKNEYYQKVNLMNKEGEIVGIIEVFHNSEDAKIRKWYIEKINKSCKEKIKKEVYGEYYLNKTCGEKTSYIKDNIYIRLDPSLKGKITNYKYLWEDIFKEVPTKNKKIPSKERIDTIKKEKQKKIDSEINKIEKDLIKQLNQSADEFDQLISKTLESLNENDFQTLKTKLEIAKDVNYYSSKIGNWENQINNINNKILEPKKNRAEDISQRLNNLLSSLDSDELSKIKEEIEKLGDPFFDDYETTWNDTIATIESKIAEKKEQDYKSSCNSYSYNEILRHPDEYVYKRAHFFGKVIQIVSKSAGHTVMRVAVSCEKNRYSSGGYLCSDAIYVSYLGSESLIEDDLIDMWGYLAGTQSYTTVLGSELTIPSFNSEYISIK